MRRLNSNSIVICCLIVYLLFCSCINPELSPPVSSDDIDISGSADKVEVVYFHRHRRCEACTYAEERISYLVTTYFADELSGGKLTFGIYDVEDKNNAAIAKRFGAIGSQLFVNRIKDGVDNISYVEEIWYWGCIDNEVVFDRTVKDVIGKALYAGQ